MFGNVFNIHLLLDTFLSLVLRSQREGFSGRGLTVSAPLGAEKPLATGKRSQFQPHFPTESYAAHKPI